MELGDKNDHKTVNEGLAHLIHTSTLGSESARRVVIVTGTVRTRASRERLGMDERQERDECAR